MQNIVGVGSFTQQIANQINQNFQQSGIGFPNGNVFYLDPFNGSDANNGQTPGTAVNTLGQGYSLLRSGYNDVLVLLSNGATTSTARLGSAFTWAKSAAHLIGACAPSRFSQRARIAPVSGVTAFAKLFTVSGSGCLFQNIEWFHGFNTGTTNQICLTVSGSENAFVNCHIAGMGDTTSAGDAGSRSLVLSAGENFFSHCAIGLDTIASAALNASVELSTAAARNVFEDCIFPRLASIAASGLIVLTAGADAIDRVTWFRRCSFDNSSTFSGGAVGTGVCKMAASAGGRIDFGSSEEFGFTDWGYDATSKAQIMVSTAGTTSASSIKIVNT